MRGEAAEVYARLGANPNVEKGEYCVVLDLSAVPPVEAPEPNIPVAARMICDMMTGMTLRDAAATAALAGYARNQIYKAQLEIKDFLGGA